MEPNDIYSIPFHHLSSFFPPPIWAERDGTTYGFIFIIIRLRFYPSLFYYYVSFLQLLFASRFLRSLYLCLLYLSTSSLYVFSISFVCFEKGFMCLIFVCISFDAFCFWLISPHLRNRNSFVFFLRDYFICLNI